MVWQCFFRSWAGACNKSLTGSANKDILNDLVQPNLWELFGNYFFQFQHDQCTMQGPHRKWMSEFGVVGGT